MLTPLGSAGSAQAMVCLASARAAGFGGRDTPETARCRTCVALWERKRLDLTVEAVILRSEWRNRFSELEREIARRRLHEYGYEPHPVGE